MVTDVEVKWELTRDRLAALRSGDIRRLVKWARRELRVRWMERRAKQEAMSALTTGLGNVMAGVTWALACRESLRRSKDHSPPGGKRPASGEMWLPREMLYAARHEVKERGWSPLTAGTWDEARNHLQVEAQRHIGEARRAKMLASGEPLVANFRIRLAGQTAAAILEPGSA